MLSPPNSGGEISVQLIFYSVKMKQTDLSEPRYLPKLYDVTSP